MKYAGDVAAGAILLLLASMMAWGVYAGYMDRCYDECGKACGGIQNVSVGTPRNCKCMERR